MDRIEAHRIFFANLISASAGVVDRRGRLTAAFASTPREKFLGPGPWKVFTSGGLVETPTDDPALLYQDITVSIKAEAGINNGQPVLHAAALNGVNVQEGETILHIGTGTGYYTAMLAKLTGANGRVDGYEIDEDLAGRAELNLADLPQAEVHRRSGSAGPLPECDVIYVSAGATAPLDVWLDALRPGGRLLFPLTPAQGFGAMLLVTRESGGFRARFICQAMFIHCAGARDDQTAAKLTEAFRRASFAAVRSLQRNAHPDETSWCAGRGWWLSTRDLQ